jgi:hypothetical protein
MMHIHMYRYMTQSSPASSELLPTTTITLPHHSGKQAIHLLTRNRFKAWCRALQCGGGGRTTTHTTVPVACGVVVGTATTSITWWQARF